MIIKRWHYEKLNEYTDFNMKPYIGYYNTERKLAILDRYDSEGFKFSSLIVQSYFENELQLIRVK